MCGIFGYIGEKDPLTTCVAGLEQLEYRGYDSTGIAGIVGGKIAWCKKEGKLSNLKSALTPQRLDLAIGHTRWATHGRVNDTNAHPHLDASGSLAIVHNGILENYDLLRRQLLREGVVFRSETDTEVIAQMIGRHYKGDLLEAVQRVVPQLRGSYAFAVIHQNHPGEIIAAALDCPLAVGTDEQKTEAVLSSDPNAFLGSTLDVLFLRNNEIARVRKGSVEVFSEHRTPLVKATERLISEYKRPSKEGFEHYLLKEIYEQPSTVQKAIFGRIEDSSGEVVFESLALDPLLLRSYRDVWILGCGTSAHAGAIGAAYFEDLARMPASVEIASEARYRSPVLSPQTLVIAISQSGETADTLAAVREAKARGCKVLGICNVKNSTLTRESDGCIFLKAGPEISVCSTKTFTSQIAVLFLFALYMGDLRGADAAERRERLRELRSIPHLIEHVLESAPAIQAVAEKYSEFENFFFMGRRYMHITAVEAALKLKEISYVNANGYPAGELKHGPIALLNPRFPVVAFCSHHKTEEKIASNLMEVKARGAPIVAFAPRGMRGVEGVADDIIWLPSTLDELAPFLSTVAAQLFAYFFARIRKCDIDRPRNLAKSVTVE
jgi:glucosamine--fructose-6-phosphate aminotransferase (isomerizing)